MMTQRKKKKHTKRLPTPSDIAASVINTSWEPKRRTKLQQEIYAEGYNSGVQRGIREGVEQEKKNREAVNAIRNRELAAYEKLSSAVAQALEATARMSISYMDERRGG